MRYISGEVKIDTISAKSSREIANSDSISHMSSSGESISRVSGLFVGINRFADPKIPDLSGCRPDAEALHALFSDAISSLQSNTLIDEQATKAAVLSGLEAILNNATSDDVVIISFSGHGTPDHRLVLHDTEVANIPETTIPMAELAERFRRSQARSILFILDCCFSGGAPARVLADVPVPRLTANVFEQFEGQGRILLAAAGISEPALEVNGHGLLSHAVLKCFLATPGPIQLLTITQQIIDMVRADASRLGYGQNPVVIGYVEGGLTFPPFLRGINLRRVFPDATDVSVTGPLSGLAIFGIPDLVLQHWKDWFPNGLNQLQIAAVNEGRVLDGQSLIVVAPTSSGKTFIGEMAAVRAIAVQKKAVFVFPYRALVNEKYDQFSTLYGDRLGMRVIRCSGDYLDQTTAFVCGKYDIAILTYEMFLSLSLANPRVLNALGLLVVDEVQFISDSRRGIVVELLLTNLLNARNRGVCPQLICLSAVIGGIAGFDDWLGLRALIKTDRPVPLCEGVLDRSGRFTYCNPGGARETIQLIPSHTIIQRRQEPSAQDVIVPLVRQLLTDNSEERVIIFRNARGSAEGCAEYLSKELSLPPATSVLDEFPDGDPSTSGQQLRRCLAGGVAFHTANLTRDERQAVEIGFRERTGPIRALAATTTVAAGINTPASTVILAEQEFFAEGENTPFSIAEYKNMAGRAGRVGYHETGRSIILALNHWQVDSLYNRYVAGTAEPLRSTLNEKDENTWLLRLLSQVSRVRKEELVALLASTYGGYIASRHHADWNARTVARLAKLVTEMLALGLLDEEEGFVSLSLLGRACGNSSLAFWSAMRVVRSLKARGDGPLAADELMILVQATSEMDAVRTPMSKRGAGEPQWPQKLAIDAGNSITRTLQTNAADNAEYQARCKRSVILRRWIAGDPIQTIEKETTTNAFFFRIAAGHIRQIADATRFHLRSAHHIASILLVNAAPNMQQVEDLCRRLETGLPSIALPLLDLPVSLDRGQYLAMTQASLVTADQIRAAGEPAVSALIGKRPARKVFAAISQI